MCAWKCTLWKLTKCSDLHLAKSSYNSTVLLRPGQGETGVLGHHRASQKLSQHWEAGPRLKKKKKVQTNDKNQTYFSRGHRFYVTSAGQQTLTLPLQCSTLKEPCAFPSAEIWQKGQQLDPGPFRHAQREITTESKAEAARPEGPRLLSPGRSPHFTGQLSKFLLKVLKDRQVLLCFLKAWGNHIKGLASYILCLLSRGGENVSSKGL